jgi:hypothetical protein
LETSVPETITVETQGPDDSATMFRLSIDDKVVGEYLTAAQTHFLIGEILERVALPRRDDRAPSRARLSPGLQ